MIEGGPQLKVATPRSGPVLVYLRHLQLFDVCSLLATYLGHGRHCY